MTRTYHECFRWWPPHPAEAIEWGTSFAAVWGSTPWGATAWENGFEIAFSLDCSTLGQAQMEVSDGWVVYLLLCKCYQRPTTTSCLYCYVARTFRRCAACSSSHVVYHQRPDAFWMTKSNGYWSQSTSKSTSSKPLFSRMAAASSFCTVWVG
jgi:hypothetical protein